MPRIRPITAGYTGVLAIAFLIALAGGWTNLAERVDGNAYDWMFRVQEPETGPAESVVLAFDEDSLVHTGGMRRIRGALADVLEILRAAPPSVVAIDITLPDAGDPVEDQRLATALSRSKSVVLASDLVANGDRWDDPLPAFRKHAAAVGHVHAEPDPVSRVLPLEKATGRDRRWAVALEAYRLHIGAAYITESPESLDVAGHQVPASRAGDSPRTLAVRYRRMLPHIPVHKLLANPGLARSLKGRAVFIGVTAQSAARDRLMTPFEQMMTGVEIHAQAFETLRSGKFLTAASNGAVALTCLALTAVAGLIFAIFSGWPGYGLGFLLVLSGHLIPHVAFSRGVVFPYLAPVAAAWISVVAAAAWQHFFVRRQLRKSEDDRARYQQAIQFVTHEMRSPLTAIQGSSELMGRYTFTEEKRKQMAAMINSESKRLASMIQTFLDVERLTDGRTELRKDEIPVTALVESCIARALPLAERKSIELRSGDLEPAALTGDRELMEYAVYNLLTNAVKYSPSETQVLVTAKRQGGDLRLAVSDQGIGMDEKELRSIFRKFYRTKKAEASGEAGTGIGLSIVQQIVQHHNGRIDVTSSPGKGSCFTMVLPCHSPAGDSAIGDYAPRQTAGPPK